ncbi:MAG: hypothetical protein PF517_13435 [Salinivirgaceae bacterium]|jgi:threonylcarbamoyladenosine tRNA methylthiotransferase MtaB|nr:hypothetical protein [Salinivirgaceae bacterium]
MELINNIKTKYPNFNITSDIIVGFSGETDHNFKETLNIVDRTKFSHVHTFKYSVRENTYAERMTNQVDEKVKNTRSDMLRQASEQYKKDYYSGFIGKTKRVLVEKHMGDNWYSRYGEHYIPIVFKLDKNQKNEFVHVKITKFEQSDKLKLEGIAQPFHLKEYRAAKNILSELNIGEWKY